MEGPRVYGFRHGWTQGFSVIRSQSLFLLLLALPFLCINLIPRKPSSTGYLPEAPGWHSPTVVEWEFIIPTCSNRTAQVDSYLFSLSMLSSWPCGWGDRVSLTWTHKLRVRRGGSPSGKAKCYYPWAGNQLLGSRNTSCSRLPGQWCLSSASSLSFLISGRGNCQALGFLTQPEAQPVSDRIRILRSYLKFEDLLAPLNYT